MFKGFDEGRRENEMVDLIDNIFNVISSGDDKSASVATSTLEFQRFLHLYNNIDLYRDCNEDEGITDFERVLIKRALTVKDGLIERAFSVAPLHIKEKMIGCIDLKLILGSGDLLLIDDAIEYIMDNQENYNGIVDDLSKISTELKEKEDKSKEALLLLSNIDLLIEDLSLSNLKAKTIKR